MRRVPFALVLLLVGATAAWAQGRVGQGREGGARGAGARASAPADPFFVSPIPVADLGIDVAPKVQLVKMDPPPKRQAGKKVASVEELVNLLHTEAKVI